MTVQRFFWGEERRNLQNGVTNKNEKNCAGYPPVILITGGDDRTDFAVVEENRPHPEIMKEMYTKTL